MRGRSCLVALTLACAACAGEGERRESEEALAARREAARSACISGQLAQQAEEQAALLRRTPAGPLAAAATFAEAFRQHARLRHIALAERDSALNHSPTPADSARHARASDAVQINAPEPNTVEANVIADYERRFRAIAADPDHPCNWQAEALE
jgi:Flp pilus assembly protein TadD